MSKKYYVAIAREFAALAGAGGNAELMRSVLARRLADIMARANPLFDRKRFLAAAKVGK